MDKKLAKTIGEAARNARLRAQLTQADVAEMVDLVTEVYGRIERGGMVPSVPTLLRLCRALRISADELLGLAGPDGSLKLTEPPGEQGEKAEIRAVLRVLRTLTTGQVKLLGRLAAALKKD
ncbi:MAG: helix-turn-helix domain-containing protein [Archangium sp.]